MKMLVSQWCPILLDPMDCSSPGTVTPLSMEFSRQEYWSGLPCPSPGDLPDLGIEPGSPSLQANSLMSESPGRPLKTPGYPLISHIYLPSNLWHHSLRDLCIMDLSCFPFLPLLLFLKDRRRARRRGGGEGRMGRGRRRRNRKREEEGRPADSQAPAFCF